MLAGELAGAPDLAPVGEARQDRVFHRLPVEHWEHPRVAQADGAGLGVGGLAEGGGAAAEDLGAGGQLAVHLQADDDFVAHSRILPYRPIVG